MTVSLRSSQFDIRVLVTAVKTMKSDDEGIVKKIAESVIKRKLSHTRFEDLI